MVILGLSFVAGLLTCLSPCVLPVVPLIVGSSIQRNRFGPLILASGLIFSFTVIGTILMLTGVAAGINESILRSLASILLILVGVVLLSHRLQERIASILSPFAARADKSMQGTEKAGLLGQFFTGSMLGVLWSPCTGPTMGATLALGAQSGPLGHVILSMFLFGLGMTTPMLAIAYGARTFLASRRSSLLASANVGKKVFGVCVLLVGTFTLFGYDKVLESALLDLLPEWITELSVKY